MAEYIYGKLKSSGEIVSIYEIPIDRKLRKGWECSCPNPNCGIDMNARRGQWKEHHFAHKPSIHGPGSGNGNGCSAGSANETALHKMAKQIIAKERRIAIPKKEILLKELNLGLPSRIQKQLPESYPIQPAAVLICEDVRLEERMADFQPDAVVVAQDKTYLVEIKAWHETDLQKKEKVAKHGRYPMLEIDLSSFLDKPISREELRSLITSEDRLREWIYYPNEAELLEQARSFFEGFEIVKEYRIRQAEKERQEREEQAQRERAERLEQEKSERAAKRREELFQPENYAAALHELKEVHYSKEVFSKFWFFSDTNTIPFFINIPITGEIIFRCDRRVWQGAIFDNFVYKRSEEKRHLYVENIHRWLSKHQKIFEVDWPLLKGSRLLSNVIERYLSYLGSLGFLSDYNPRRKYYYVASRHTIIPQNQEYAQKLQAALRDLRSNKSSPDIDSLIRKELEPYLTSVREKAAALRRAQEEQQKKEKQEAERAALEQKKAAAAAREKERIESFDFTRNDVPPCYDNEGYLIVECVSCHTTSRVEPRPSRVEGYPYLVTSCRNCRKKNKSPTQ